MSLDVADLDEEYLQDSSYILLALAMVLCIILDKYHDSKIVFFVNIMVLIFLLQYTSKYYSITI